MSRHVLLYNGNCERCSNLAAKITTVTEGKLETARLADPCAAEWALDANVELPQRPALVVLSGKGTKLLTGLGMMTHLIRHLGPRRGAAVLNIIGEDRTRTSEGRRSLLRTGVVGLGIAVGAVMLPGTAHADPELSAEETISIRNLAANYDRMDVVHARLTEHGFKTTPESEFVAGKAEDAVVLSFYARNDGNPHHAAVLARRVTDGSVKGALDLVSGNPAKILNGDRINVKELQLTRVSLARPGEVEPLGPRDYYLCMVACMGVQCGVAGAACRLIPNLPAMLACFYAFCLGPTAACHEDCVDQW